MAQWGPTGGTHGAGPKYSSDRLLAQSQAYRDLQYRWNPRQWVDRMWDFDGEVQSYTLSTTITNNVSNAGLNVLPGADTNTAIGFFVVPRDGVLIEATIVAEDTLAASDTNYQTFALTNKAGAAGATVAMLAATDANTTKSTGGSALTALVPRTLTLSGTAASLRVNKGDILYFKATATLTPTVSDAPTVRLKIATLPEGLTPLSSRIVGSVLINPVANTANGEAAFTLGATNEAQVAGCYYGDQVIIPATKQVMFEALVKFGTHAANERCVVGLMSAYNATLDNIVSNAWFKIDGSMALVVESDDGTTDTDDQSAGATLTAGTYYLLRIDMSRTGAINFFVDESYVGSTSAPLLAVSNLLQPVILTQKDSGTGVPSVTCDLLRVIHARY